MIRKITNQALDYAWGSKTLISDYFGTQATGNPMAEIWFGTHPGSPAVFADDTNTTLLEGLGGKPLSYLLKILAADSPLSIQAHPNAKQAREGFARENAAGVPIDAANRNYKDDRHKPEMIVALIDGFEALCGFRELQETIAIFESFGPKLAEFTNLLKGTDALRRTFTRAIELRGQLCEINAELARHSVLAAKLEGLYPGDPGVLIAMLLNHVTLRSGEALFLPAGNVHAYLSGLGVEIMAASDNVLRGGLTPKFVDAEELQRIVDFSAIEVNKVALKPILSGLSEYAAGCEDFKLYRLDLTGSTVLADLQILTDSILLCTGGELAVSDSLGERVVLGRGEAAVISSDARFVSLAGSATGFLAS